MKKNAPNYPAAPGYPKPAKSAPVNKADKAAAKTDKRELAREEHSNHFTSRADAKGK